MKSQIIIDESSLTEEQLKKKKQVDAGNKRNIMGKNGHKKKTKNPQVVNEQRKDDRKEKILLCETRMCQLANKLISCLKRKHC